MLLISFLHQTTTFPKERVRRSNCFLSHFYIKPQLAGMTESQKVIASYLISTSNHNPATQSDRPQRLLLISFLHQTTTMLRRTLITVDCFLSHFYIKPQPLVVADTLEPIASYLISTSNHNQVCFPSAMVAIASYLISTSNHNLWCPFRIAFALLLISFLHQTTTRGRDCTRPGYCFLSHFYIKPQRILYNPLIYKELGHVAHIRSG